MSMCVTHCSQKYILRWRKRWCNSVLTARSNVAKRSSVEGMYGCCRSNHVGELNEVYGSKSIERVVGGHEIPSSPLILLLKNTSFYWYRIVYSTAKMGGFGGANAKRMQKFLY